MQSDLRTPFRMQIQSDPAKVDRVIGDNTDPYRLFALRSQMWPMLNEGESIIFRRIDVGGDLWTVVNIMLGGDALELSSERHAELQRFIDETLAKPPLCLLYETEREEVLTWPYPEGVVVTHDQGRLYADLSGVDNYVDLYNQLNVSIHHSLANL